MGGGATPNSTSIIESFRKFFQQFGVPEELSLDGGPNISSEEVTTFLKQWGTIKRKSSAHYPKSNGRAEAAVKSMKRLIRGNTGPQGTLNTNEMTKALLQYRNTPLQNCNKSPAQLLMGRNLRDSVPQPQAGYKVSPHWEYYLRGRELSMIETNEKMKEYHDAHGVKNLDSLTIGMEVLFQNARNKRWDRSGVIVKVGKYRQYTVKMSGSGRLSDRNRAHLRPMLAVKPHIPTSATSSSSSNRPNMTRGPQSTETSSSSSDHQSVVPPSSSSSSSSSTSSECRNRPAQQNVPRQSRRLRRPPIRYGEWMM